MGQLAPVPRKTCKKEPTPPKKIRKQTNKNPQNKTKKPTQPLKDGDKRAVRFHVEFSFLELLAKAALSSPVPRGLGLPLPRGGGGLEAPRHLSRGDSGVYLTHPHSYGCLRPWPKQQFPGFTRSANSPAYKGSWEGVWGVLAELAGAAQVAASYRGETGIKIQPRTPSSSSAKDAKSCPSGSDPAQDEWSHFKQQFKLRYLG